jgi:two-component system cell cycle sensor histidine kinase PleC
MSIAANEQFAPNSLMKRLVLQWTILIAFLIALVGFFHKLEELEYQSYIRDLKLEETLNLVEVRQRIESDIYQKMLEISELAAIIGQNPEMNQTEFNIRAVDYVLANPEVMYVAAAQDLIVSIVFPKFGNERLIGVDYKIKEEEYARILAAARTGDGLVSGPIETVQGGQGLVLRKPIFGDDGNGIKRLWGVLSVMLDHRKYVEHLGLPELEQNYDLLIRALDFSPNQQIDTIFGDDTLMARDPVQLQFSFPFADWLLAATKDGGWPAHKPGYYQRWLKRLMLSGVCILLLWYLLRLFEERRAAERKLHVGVEALDHGFAMFDADRRLITFNEKYRQFSGVPKLVRLGASYEELILGNLKLGLIPEAVGREEEWFKNWSSSPDTSALLIEKTLDDGRSIRTYDRAIADGSIVALRVDVTDLKKAQLAAEAANNAKTEFMGVLSHELRTPLTVILGNARLVKNISEMQDYRDLVEQIKGQAGNSKMALAKLGKVDSSLQKMMTSLEQSGEHLLSLISEILDFAKSESGSLTLTLEKVSTSSVLDSVLDELRPLAEKKDLILCADVVECEIEVDRKRLRQILINLIGNAIKFTDEGSISVRTKVSGQSVIIEVQDSGIGIDESKLELVFEPFLQVDSSSGRKYGGTGLGLAISRDLARAHGGELSLTSVLNHGSTFTLCLPLRQQPVPAHSH